MPTVPTFTARETDVSQHNGGTSGVPLKPLRDDSALRDSAMGPIFPPKIGCENATVGKNGLIDPYISTWVTFINEGMIGKFTTHTLLRNISLNRYQSLVPIYW